MVEVVGARVRAAREGGGGWGQIPQAEPPGLCYGKRLAGGLIFQQRRPGRGGGNLI